MVKKVELPIGEVIDALYQARQARLDLEKEVEALKEREREAKAAVIARLNELKLDRASGSECTASVTMRRTMVVTDWPTFWAWARKDKTGVYVQKRIAVEATREVYESGKQIPGAQPEDLVDLSLTKAKRA